MDMITQTDNAGFPSLQHGIDFVICTYNRLPYLQSCVDSILPQLTSPDTRLTIVDNHSDDGTAEWVKDLMTLHPNVHYEYVVTQGLSHSRNRAAGITPYSHLLYIDDDCIVPDGFVETALSLLQTSFAWDAIGGPYYALYEGVPPVKNPDDGFSFTLPYHSSTVLGREYIRGGCMMLRTEVWRQLNGFDTRLGMKGKEAGYGEEIEFQQRMRKNSFTIAYAPALYVYHAVRPEKERVAWKLKAAYARRRDKRLFDPLPMSRALFQLLRMLAGRIFWTPVHLFRWMVTPGYTWHRCKLDILEPLWFGCGEWAGSWKSPKRGRS